jgi:8-oxo-dGTP pyrophosphatase MutT (NUDIX family)
MSADAWTHRLRRALAAYPSRAAAAQPGWREAAVAVVVRPGPTLELLLIRRAERATDPWSGHVALPGGTRAPGDTDLRATAFRETEEETGVALNRIGTLLGRLDPVAPVSPRLPPILIAPFVVAVPAGTPAVPDLREVQSALWVPVPSLLDTASASHILIDVGADRVRFPALQVDGHEIWGLTLRILRQFLDTIESAGLADPHTLHRGTP